MSLPLPAKIATPASFGVTRPHSATTGRVDPRRLAPACHRAVATSAAVTDRIDTDDDWRRSRVYAGDVRIHAGGSARGGAPPATRIAWGDIDGDGRDELVIGLGQSDGVRRLILEA